MLARTGKVDDRGAPGHECSFIRPLGLLTLVLSLVSPLRAELITLAPVADTTIYEDPSGSVSNGAGSAMFAGRNSSSGNSVRRALVAFDLTASIPADSTIIHASLTLYNDAANVAPQIIALHRLTRGWGEGESIAAGGQGSGAAAEPGDATWLHRNFDTAYWSSPGGDFEPLASSALVVEGAGYYTWPSTNTLVADLQDFIHDPTVNFGWLLVGNETEAGSARRFATREAVDSGLRPQLSVEFTVVPEPSSFFCLAVTLLACTSRRPGGASLRRTPSCQGNSRTPGRTQLSRF